MRIFNDIKKSELIFGDNLQVMDELPAYAFSLILTDPPYLFTKHRGKLPTKNCTKRFSSSPLYDYTDTTGQCLIKVKFGEEEINRWLDMTPRLMREYNAYIFCSEEQIGIYQKWAVEHGYKFSILVWEKPYEVISKKRWSQNVEFIVRIYKDGTGLNKIEDSSMYNRVFHYGRIRNKIHPTQKPVEMLERIIVLSSKEGDAVLDPFAGSASTYIASLHLKRKCVSIENNKIFYERAKIRIENEEKELL